MKRYNPSDIEPKWQQIWSDQKTYRADDDSQKPPYYALSFFPYPSGAGLHIGHVRNFTITDVVARYKRMQGFEVLHPMGWDSFGLPGENYAIKTGISPQVSTKQNTDNFRTQAQAVGLSIDWDREFASTDPDYYRWTQWFFKLLFEKGLAYQKESLQFWCETDRTVLANEQVENGKCWRCGNLVTKKAMKQWFFKITDYADRLSEDLNKLDWPEGIIQQQRNWIGKSKGAEVLFAVDNFDEAIHVFTTRPDTLYGATFMVLAPEHELIRKITTDEQKADVEAYVVEAVAKTDIDRMDESREKTGVSTGAYAVNPVNGEKIPIWIADYVLMGYGTGAIMAVPAHDERDNEFAKRFDLSIVEVVSRPDSDVKCYSGEGPLLNSGPYDGVPSAEAREQIVAHLTREDKGTEKVNYRIRDWLISRQRYWGAPIPIVHCPKDGAVAVPDDQLPVVLPELDDYAPSGDGRSPLARISDWVNTSCPKCGGTATRETDTMDGFACSSWYFLRFADPKNNDEAFSQELARHWLPVDMYIGGAEHAVMHLLYARMWTKVMFDEGMIEFDEPFTALRNQGMLLASDGSKISKSKDNGIDPMDIIKQGYGADALRTIILFLAPYNQSTPWSDEGLAGAYRFLTRVWTLVQEHHENETEGEAPQIAVHKTIKKVTDDLERLSFNTAIAAQMELVNELNRAKANGMKGDSWHGSLSALVQLLAPFAPHMAEELWQQLGHEGTVHLSKWPTWDDALLVEDTVTIAVQVNGKVRAEMTIAKDATESAVTEQALELDRIKELLDNKKPTKIIYVPGRLVSIVK